MFRDHLLQPQASQGYWKKGTCSDTCLNPMQLGPDDQLIADCRALSCQITDLFTAIEQAAKDRGDEQEDRQAFLREADDRAMDLMGRIAVTPASTLHGVQGKHAVAGVLLATDWYDEPSPYRDALLLSFVRDAARLRYPTVPEAGASTDKDQEATDAVIDHSRTCLRIIAELAASFALKDRISELGQPDPDDLDAIILALRKRKKVAVEALIRLPAPSTAGIHAKRLVLRRMLEAGDSDAHHLRVQLAQSFCGDLDALHPANTYEHEPSLAYVSIWNTLSTKFRWLMTMQHR